MPYTPFHFGLHACVGLVFRRKFDLPMFIGANVVIDLEPLVVMWFDLRYPLHGYLHTLLFGGLAGVVFAFLAHPLRSLICRLMCLLRLGYRPSLGWMLLSAVLGAWLHVLLDSFLYYDIQPFYPYPANPFLNLFSETQIYVTCLLSFPIAGILYIHFRKTVAKHNCINGLASACKPAGLHRRQPRRSRN